MGMMNRKTFVREFNSRYRGPTDFGALNEAWNNLLYFHIRNGSVRSDVDWRKPWEKCDGARTEHLPELLKILYSKEDP